VPCRSASGEPSLGRKKRLTWESKPGTVVGQEQTIRRGKPHKLGVIEGRVSGALSFLKRRPLVSSQTNPLRKGSGPRNNEGSPRGGTGASDDLVRVSPITPPAELKTEYRPQDALLIWREECEEDFALRVVFR